MGTGEVTPATWAATVRRGGQGRAGLPDPAVPALQAPDNPTGFDGFVQAARADPDLNEESPYRLTSRTGTAGGATRHAHSVDPRPRGRTAN
jgi:hypothetical protein